MRVLISGLGVVGARVEQGRCPADGFRVEWVRVTGFSGVGAERDGSEVDCVLANGRHDEGKRILIG